MIKRALIHHGIEGQRWGDQNGPPYPLSPEDYSAREKAAAKADKKFVRKYSKKITKKAEKESSKEIRAYEKELRRSGVKMRTSTGQLAKNYINQKNKKLAELMNSKVEDIKSPSGMVVRFVAKRGEQGVLFALASPDYDMRKVKNGLHSSGRAAYRTEIIDRI